jgi:uncharacterized membrane protein
MPHKRWNDQYWNFRTIKEVMALAICLWVGLTSSFIVLYVVASFVALSMFGLAGMERSD